VPNRRRDLVEITASELDCRGSDPAVHLLRRAGADNGSAAARAMAPVCALRRVSCLDGN
jgi:hypothetical protein